MKNNIKNIQQAKAAAQRIYKKINFDGGNLQYYEISSLMQETYDFLKIPFKPQTNDIKEYAKILDANGDGQVNLKDLEQIAVKFLCGDNILTDIPNKIPVNYQANIFSQSTNPSNQINSYSNQQNSISNQQSSQKTQYTPNNYQNISNNTGDEFAYTFNGNKNINQSAEHLSSKQSNQPKFQQHYFQQNQEPKSKYTENALKYLTITRNLFKKYCNYQTNTITREKVVPLLTQTYGSLGRKGYYPSEQDVNVWMKLCDTNNDGHVQQADYEYFVIRALERSSVQVYNQ